MPRAVLLLASLLLAATLLAPRGSLAKDKRGWTLNSAGYLLGPHAVDNHRAFQHKQGLAGRRGLQPGDGGPGLAKPLPESWAVRTALDFLDFLRLREAGGLGSPPDMPDMALATSSEEAEQP